METTDKAGETAVDPDLKYAEVQVSCYEGIRSEGFRRRFACAIGGWQWTAAQAPTVLLLLGILSGSDDALPEQTGVWPPAITKASGGRVICDRAVVVKPSARRALRLHLSISSIFSNRSITFCHTFSGCRNVSKQKRELITTEAGGIPPIHTRPFIHFV